MNILKISALACLLISFASCKRDYSDSPNKTPKNIAGSSDFKCDTFYAVSNSFDFTYGAPFSFTANFNETVSWKIELHGQSSTAIKTLSGTSSQINAINSAWLGNHDGLYYFEKGELVTANLIISGKKGISESINFTITEVKNATTTTPNFMLVTSTSDFEKMGVYPSQFSIFPTTGIYKEVYRLQDDQIRAPQGTRYLRLEGVSTEPNGFFVGGIQCRKNAVASTYFLPVAWTDPSKIYLNVFVRGKDLLPENNLPYATLNFECHEDDNHNPSTIANCDYYAKKPAGTNTDYFCPSSEDAWVFKIPITHEGWQLFSAKYSDLLPSEDFGNGGFGNRKLEPQKLARVQFGLVSSPPFNLVSVDIDYACFTYGAPLDPNK